RRLVCVGVDCVGDALEGVRARGESVVAVASDVWESALQGDGARRSEDDGRVNRLDEERLCRQATEVFGRAEAEEVAVIGLIGRVRRRGLRPTPPVKIVERDAAPAERLSRARARPLDANAHHELVALVESSDVAERDVVGEAYEAGRGRAAGHRQNALARARRDEKYRERESEDKREQAERRHGQTPHHPRPFAPKFCAPAQELRIVCDEQSALALGDSAARLPQLEADDCEQRAEDVEAEREQKRWADAQARGEQNLEEGDEVEEEPVAV